MSFPNQPPHMFPYIPQFINPPIGTTLTPSAPISMSKPSASVTVSTENTNRYSINAFERPITTVFIGNISEKIPDSLMKDVLMKCGNVLSWKRVQGASGKLQAFGFCEYDNPEATLRCIRLLNEFCIAEKPLVVKVDPKTDELLTEYKCKKQKAIEDREAEDVSKTEDAKRERINAIHAREKDDDNNSLNQIKKLIKEYSSELLIEESEKKGDAVNLNIEDVDLDGDKKNLISREIEIFRNKHKDEDTSEDKEERYQRIRERKERENERNSDTRSHRRHRSGSRSKTDKHTPDDERSRKRSRADSRTSSVKSKKRRSESRDTHKSHKKESDKELDEYEAAVFKRLEKKLRDKEAAYQKRLQLWEGREKKRIKEYESEEERRIRKENDIAEEARKLQIFFEDYDDEKWDIKYYRGAELERRYIARRNEEMSDERDRQKEMEQIEQTRQRLIMEDNPQAESIILKMEQSMQEHLQRKLVIEVETERVIVKEESETIALDEVNDNNESTLSPDRVSGAAEEDCTDLDQDTSIVDHDAEPSKIEEENCDEMLNNIANDNSISHVENDITTIETTESAVEGTTDKSKSQSSMSSTERNAMVKKIIDGIPTLKADLFAYPIEWAMVDELFVDSRIKPWVDKKIATYIGEEEPSLSMFICKQVLKHRTPDEILSDIAMVLEEEADVFVMKMWRLLIYVIEERKCGLDK